MPAGTGRDEITVPGPGDEATGPVDEVGVDLGRDEGTRGLLDSWAGRTAPGELTQGEATGALAAEELPLTAVLARVAASLGRPDGLERLAGARGQPSRAVKALIADEPLDPLPVPEGLSLVGTGFLDAAPEADITAVGRRPGPRPAPAPPAGELAPSAPVVATPPPRPAPRSTHLRLALLVAILLAATLLLAVAAVRVLRGA
ncbi:hypothetical protein L6R53_02700 [Myxococcota bacterium]|nr:hypothetical protein [Myxococcota bacterium]